MWVAAPKLSKVPFLRFHYIQYYDVLSMLSIEYNFLCVTLREIKKKINVLFITIFVIKNYTVLFHFLT